MHILIPESFLYLHMNEIAGNKRLFRFLLKNYFLGFLPFILLQALLIIFEVVPMHFNNEEVYGIKGVLYALMFLPFIVIMITVFSWVFLKIGLLVQRLFTK